MFDSILYKSEDSEFIYLEKMYFRSSPHHARTHTGTHTRRVSPSLVQTSAISTDSPT